MPYFRQRSLVFAPASASFSTAMICSSLKRFAFIVRSHCADSTLSPYYSRGSPQCRRRHEQRLHSDRPSAPAGKSVLHGQRRDSERKRPQSLRLGTLEFTSAAILAGSALATGYDCDHSSELSATATIFTVRFCAGSSTAP